MASVAVLADPETVAATAAEITAGVLNGAVQSNGSANWLLSGGSAPMDAYRLLAKDYKDKINWNEVIVAVGDERCVPLDDPDANWHQINQTLLAPVFLPKVHQLRPHIDQTAEAAAKEYEHSLSNLATNGQGGIPHFDLAWLGMGEDGHTLSLFPEHQIIAISETLVVPVHNAPKPLPDRISLTYKALGNVSNCLILVTGISKAQLLAKIFGGDNSLPISKAVAAIEAGGGKVTWLLDDAAYSFIR